MPAWSATKEAITKRNNDYDGIRRERIRVVEEISGRPLIIYATAFLERGKVAVSQGEIGIDNEGDIDALSNEIMKLFILAEISVIIRDYFD